MGCDDAKNTTGGSLWMYETMEIPTRYNPKLVEEKWYKFWEERNLFRADANSKKKPYTIVIPPPNITGILHMGHALNNTIQDILIRYKRMQNFEALWLPGTDHAGIATQNVVEKQLAMQNLKRQDLGRDEFLKRVWKWKEEYGSTIVKQLRRLGCSCDWSRERFTMDEGLSEAVREVFIRLYNKGLIYRGDYIINWCPRCQTALSDEEAQHREVDGMLYYIKYMIKKPVPRLRSGLTLSEVEVPVASPSATLGTGAERSRSASNPALPARLTAKPWAGRQKPEKREEYIIVATTRPETMLGDVAVAVNPKDKRYKALKVKTLILPILNRELKVIYDSVVDIKFGTGALKVTPAHDPVDFELGIKHNLTPINVMNEDATMNEHAGERYKGMDRFECRKAIVEDLKKDELLLKTEPYRHAVGHCYRCGTMVEPRLSKQWFVKMKPLAKPAIQAVKANKLKFYPRRWTKIYLEWMENIRDWCISRQIWWGHRIPVYYCKNCQETGIRKSKVKSKKSKFEKGVIVSKIKPEKCPNCGSTDIEQDPDVLDTWFSSWLWPFSTMGWPDKTKDLSFFYPTDTLVTAQEIIFFWVARMVMAGVEFMDDIPFRDVYIHGTVRDITGTKMSKSLGNIIDPLEIINEFGADALRFSIISITGVGGDLFLSKEKFYIGRNFANKLWNASRFVLQNLDKDKIDKDPCIFYEQNKLELKERWILSSFYRTLKEVSSALDKYRINDAAKIIYEFFWHQFCDWYLEFAKSTIQRPDTQLVLYEILEKSLRITHPFMPFITEETWQCLSHSGESIMISSWPHMKTEFVDEAAEKDMELVISAITSIRNTRADWLIDPARPVDAVIKCGNEHAVKILEENKLYIQKLGKTENLKISKRIEKPRHSATSVAKDVEIFVLLEGIVDFDKERKRLGKRVDDNEQLLKGIAIKLKNSVFLKKAPPEVVASEKEKMKELESVLHRLKKNISDLK